MYIYTSYIHIYTLMPSSAGCVGLSTFCLSTFCLSTFCPTTDSEGFKGGTRGTPIMPRDAVSRTANVERTARH